MKASEFVTQIQKKHRVEIKTVSGGLRVRGLKRLPKLLQAAIAGHRHQLQRWLIDGIDEELSKRKYHDDLESLGFFRIKVLEKYDGDYLTETYAWTHANGDSVLEEFLAGLLDPAEIAADHQRRVDQSKEAEWSNQHPPRGRIFGRWLGRIPGL